MIIGGTANAQVMRNMQPPSFDSLDKNSSGDITLDELKAGGPNGSSDAKSAARAEQLFKTMDTDGSGSVSTDEKDAFDAKLQEQRQEMQFFAQLLAGGGRPPSAGDIFATTDKDGSGGVSLAEFSDSEAAERLSSDDISEVFTAIDTDGNGEISEAETSDLFESLESAFAAARAGGADGPGGRPPGPPPSAGSEEEDDETTGAIDLLTAATAAYSKQSQSATDLLSTLTRIFDEAA
jgi:Ca2+-binding EF-hand superfamily protein